MRSEHTPSHEDQERDLELRQEEQGHVTVEDFRETGWVVTANYEDEHLW